MKTLDIISDRAKICGSDGICIGTVDQVEGDRIRLINEGDEDHRRYISGDSVGSVENGIVWLRVKAAEVVSFEDGATTYDQ